MTIKISIIEERQLLEEAYRFEHLDNTANTVIRTCEIDTAKVADDIRHLIKGLYKKLGM